jgi:transposase
LGVIPNRAELVRRLIGKLGRPEQLWVCYTTGPTGYVLYWKLTELVVHCEVVAPTLVPVKAGDRVKTDRRDAEKLARCYRAGDLTAVWVPDAAHEALRDLVRARLAAKRDQLRARHRLGRFLLRQGRRAPEGTTTWTGKYMAWVKQQHFEHAAERIVRLERSIDAAVESMPESYYREGRSDKHLRDIRFILAATVACGATIRLWMQLLKLARGLMTKPCSTGSSLSTPDNGWPSSNRGWNSSTVCSEVTAPSFRRILELL